MDWDDTEDQIEIGCFVCYTVTYSFLEKAAIHCIGVLGRPGSLVGGADKIFDGKR